MRLTLLFLHSGAGVFHEPRGSLCNRKLTPDEARAVSRMPWHFLSLCPLLGVAKLAPNLESARGLAHVFLAFALVAMHLPVLA